MWINKKSLVFLHSPGKLIVYRLTFRFSRFFRKHLPDFWFFCATHCIWELQNSIYLKKIWKIFFEKNEMLVYRHSSCRGYAKDQTTFYKFKKKYNSLEVLQKLSIFWLWKSVSFCLKKQWKSSEIMDFANMFWRISMEKLTEIDWCLKQPF